MNCFTAPLLRRTPSASELMKSGVDRDASGGALRDGGDWHDSDYPKARGAKGEQDGQGRVLLGIHGWYVDGMDPCEYVGDSSTAFADLHETNGRPYRCRWQR